MKSVALISLYGIENNGIRSISSVLQKAGFATYLIFFKRWFNNDIRYPTEEEKKILVSLLKELEVEIVGISFTSPFLKIAQALTQQIKSILPVSVIWGGIHATVEPQESLTYCDFVCRGEGEYAMLELVNAYLHIHTIENIKNICYRKGDTVIMQELRPLIQQLDTLPYQDYAGDNKFYIDKTVHHVDPLVYASELRVFASRGCPFHCSYCYNSIFNKLYEHQQYHRIRTVEYVISEIEYALDKLRRIRKIKFDDDTFIFPRAWIDEFCKHYRRRVGLPLRFY